MGIYVKDTFLKIFGYLLIIFGGFVLLLGIAMWIEGQPEHYEAGRGITIISPILWLPGLLMILKANKISTEEKKIEYIVQLMKTYRRISLESLASKAGISLFQLESLLAKALSNKLIKGKIDRTTEEFYLDQTDSINIKHCQSCGASINKTFLPGDTMKCPNCGNLL